MNSGTATWQVIAYASVVAGAAALCAALIVLLRPLLARYAVARPNARSSHKIPTPQGGGIAVVTATLAVSAVVIVIDPRLEIAAAQFGLIAAATSALAIVGAADDIMMLAVVPRLASQAIAVAVVVALQPPDVHIVSFIPLWVERIALALAGVWFVNLVNFMDGIDWMTVTEVVPVTLGLVILAALSALPPLATLMALTLLGATIGFAPFNRPVAKLFLGDVGSLPIGLFLFWMLLQLASGGHLAAALLLPLYYVADTTLTLIRRILNGEHVTQAHRTHFYQRATERGHSVPQVVSRVFALNVALVALAVATVAVPSPLTGLVCFSLGTALVAWLLATFLRGAMR